MKRSIIPIFIPHVGCPNDCVFCNQRHIAQPHAPQPCEVEEIIKNGLEYASLPQLSFYGGSFTAIERGLMEGYLHSAYGFVKAGLADSIRISTRPDAIDEDVLDILCRYGVKTIELGAQSMSDGVLLLSKRGHTARDTEEASRLIKARGLELILQMMVGLPGSREDDEYHSAREIAALAPDGVRIYPVCVIADTELCTLMENGKYAPLTVERAVELCAGLVDIFERQGIPVVRLGLNPTEELSGGAVRGGAYHPSLGELVYSRRFLDKLLPYLTRGEKLTVTVPPKGLSIARGQKNRNVHFLLQNYQEVKILGKEGQTEPFIITVE